MAATKEPALREREKWHRLEILVPPRWMGELHEVAEANGQSIAAIVRMALRAFLRERYARDGN